MNKFNESVQIEETTEFKDNEVMNELNNEQQFTSMAHKRRVERLQNDNIQVGDKVQWTQWRGDTPVEFKGRVESIGEFNSVKTFNVRKFEESPAITMITASRVTKIGK